MSTRFRIVWGSDEDTSSLREFVSFKEFDWDALDKAGKEDLLSRAEEQLDEAVLDGSTDFEPDEGFLTVEVFEDDFDLLKAATLMPKLEALLDNLLPPKPVVVRTAKQSETTVVRASSLHSDLFKRPLFVGDVVAAIQPMYRNLVQATVVSLTPKKVRVEWTQGSYKSQFLADPHCVVKKDG